jgi:hypothetical protein
LLKSEKGLKQEKRPFSRFISLVAGTRLELVTFGL